MLIISQSFSKSGIRECLTGCFWLWGSEEVAVKLASSIEVT